MATRIPVTLVNHVSIDIACAPDRVWALIVDHYVDARKFRDVGYTIEPLEAPAAFLGGYGMRFEQGGTVLDERVCRITERDESARRLSMVADYLCVPGGMTVHATYQAHADQPATRFAIDCHSSLYIDAPADGSRQAVQAAVAEMTGQYEAALVGYLHDVRSKLEA